MKEQHNAVLPVLAETARRLGCAVVTLDAATLLNTRSSYQVAQTMQTVLGELPLVLLAYTENGTLLLRGEMELVAALRAALSLPETPRAGDDLPMVRAW